MFWKRFYDLCTDKGTKPNPVAKKAGISSATITQWKQGAVPAGDSLIKIADELECSVDYLLDRTKNPQSHILGNSITTGDISLSNNSVVGDGQVGITIHNGAPQSGQAEMLLNIFNSLDLINQSKLIVYADSLKNNANNE